MSIKIVTDSTSDIPKELIDLYNIDVVPLTVNFEDGSYLDKIEITTHEFYSKLKRCDKLPTTSQASPNLVYDVINKNLVEGHEVIGIFLSSKFSGTFNSAVAAKYMINNSAKVHLIDSKTACLGTCLLVIEACKMVREGKKCKEILKRVEILKNNVTVFGKLETLKYLEKGGRLTKGMAIAGTLLNIKPILKVFDSKVEVVDKVRGKNKAVKWLEDKIDELNLDNNTIGIYHSENEDAIEKLSDYVNSKFENVTIIKGEIGPVIGTHLGPGGVAIGYFDCRD